VISVNERENSFRAFMMRCASCSSNVDFEFGVLKFLCLLGGKRSRAWGREHCESLLN